MMQILMFRQNRRLRRFLQYCILFCFFPHVVFSASTSGIFELDDPSAYTQVMALSDVHGMYDEVTQELQAAGLIDKSLKWAGGKTLLIIIGDSIDKGPNSVGVIDLWIRLTHEANGVGGKVVHLLGNHEAELMAYGKKSGKSEVLFEELKRKGIKKKDFIDPASRWGKFIRTEPVAARVGRWFFSHSGYYPDMKWNDFVSQANKILASEQYDDPLLLDDQSVLEAKDWWAKPKKRNKVLSRLSENGMWGLVQGHQPKAYDIKFKIGAIENGRFIKVDNGMAPEAGSNPGRILRFAKPVQMTQTKLPQVEVIKSSGKIEDLPIYDLQ